MLRGLLSLIPAASAFAHNRTAKRMSSMRSLPPPAPGVAVQQRRRSQSASSTTAVLDATSPRSSEVSVQSRRRSSSALARPESIASLAGLARPDSISSLTALVQEYERSVEASAARHGQKEQRASVKIHSGPRLSGRSSGSLLYSLTRSSQVSATQALQKNQN
jgi:hypothetical protein